MAALLAILPAATLLAEELPSDRQELGAGRQDAGKDSPLLLPPPDATSADSGRNDWATTDGATIQREEHLRRVSAAYGAAGAFTGLAVSAWLVSVGQDDPGVKRGWRYAALGAGGLAGLGLAVGTVLWATTPPAPGSPRFALGPSGSLVLAFDFD